MMNEFILHITTNNENMHLENTSGKSYYNPIKSQKLLKTKVVE